ncbi:LIP-domain-containing protein [Fusarium coicis]|nr:LIP-domain-containing protein [Fusarium coicis]
MLSTVSTFAFLLPLAAAAVATPSEDPFYKAPAGYKDASPGDILAYRKAPAKLAAFQAIPLNVKDVWQVSYRSTDVFGSPQASVSTIIIPYNADYSKVISYQIAEDAAYINCSHSYVLQQGTNTTYAGTSSIEVLLMAGALRQGWVISSPDWEGPQSSFIEGVQARQSTLDSIRAALKSNKFMDIRPSAAVQVWGYSGEWRLVALRQMFRASTRLSTTVFFVGLSFAALGSLTKIFSNVKDAIDAQLVPAKKDAFYSSLERCFYDDGYKAQNDEISPVVDTDAVAKKYCNAGMSITYVWEAAGEHFTEAALSIGDVLNSLNPRFTGTPVSGCTTRDVLLSPLSSPQTAATAGTFIVGTLLSLLSIPIGLGNL